MNTESYFSKALNQTFNPKFEYKGYTIYKGDAPILYNKGGGYVNADGTPANKNIPLFYSLVIKNKRSKPEPHLHVSMFGGDLNGDIDACDYEYTTNAIDKYIQNEREYTLKKWDKRNKRLHYTYICNNVTINVLQDLNDTYLKSLIYVNERSLRNVTLSENFTFNDVLEQVYINTISKYNSCDFSMVNTKKYQNKKTETIDLSILPVYEFLGLEVKHKDIVFIPYNVYFSYADNKYKFECNDNKQIMLSVDEIKEVELKEVEISSILALTILRHKHNFYE
jgi:hypothetical protein